MIPIIFEKEETAFISNGLGRLHDMISCTVTEERNGVYELDFQYATTGANYDLIQLGRIVGVTHDDTGDIQPFDIVSFSKPIDNIVTFHCVHISYRQSYMTVTGTNINSLADTFTLFGNAEPSNPFTYSTDKTSAGYLACMDGTPRTVRETMGGIEGSILDAYGGEWAYDKWNVFLYANRGQYRDFTIRYGVNMTDYKNDTDIQGTYSSCIPYWTDGENFVVGDRQDNGSTITGRGECVPLDVSDKFESQPTKAQVESMGASVLGASNSTIPAQTITVSFIRLQDSEEYSQLAPLMTCNLCDTINVVYSGTSANFKIVKTVWNVLDGKYEEMELGHLSTTLSEALGISNTLDRTGGGSTPLPEVEEVSINATSSTGTFIAASSHCYRWGNVVYIRLVFRNASNVASGSNVWVGTVTGAPKPVVDATGAGYYGAHALNGSFTALNAVTVRNSSASAVQIASPNMGAINFTYITNE